MDCLTREAILTADDLPREAVEVPEWGGTIYVRTLTGEERAQLGLALPEEDDGRVPRMQAAIAALAVCDAAGKRLFTLEDIEKLAGKSALALSRVWDVADRLNGITVTAHEVRRGN